jgi:hypothetical protein
MKAQAQWQDAKATKGGTIRALLRLGERAHARRRDVPFWRTLALQSDGPVLELGCGTGRISIPLARPACRLSASIDRKRCSRGAPAHQTRPADVARTLLRGDIRALPFRRDISARHGPTACCSRCCANAIPGPTLQSVAACSSPRATFGIELVA